jgi:hypothetical protein
MKSSATKLKSSEVYSTEEKIQLKMVKAKNHAKKLTLANKEEIIDNTVFRIVMFLLFCFNTSNIFLRIS